MINIILFGPPGSGKGTQSEFLIKKYGLAHISTGDIIRKEIQDETPLAAKLRNLPPSQLAPDEIVIGMVENFIITNKSAPGFLFDGFPRTIPQAIALDEMLGKYNQSITRLISLVDISREELVKRLLERGKTSGRKDDQDPKIINERLDIYDDDTLSVQAYYSNVNKVKKITGDQPIPQVTELIEKEMNNFFIPQL